MNQCNNLLFRFLRDCDDKEVLTEGDNKISQIKGFSGVGRYTTCTYEGPMYIRALIKNWSIKILS